MSKTVSCCLSSETHEKLLDKCNEKGMTVNDFVKVLVQSALDGTPCDSTSNRLDSTKKSETDFRENKRYAIKWTWKIVHENYIKRKF